MVSGRSDGEVTTPAFDHVAGPFAAFDQQFVIRCSDPAFAGFLRELYAPMGLTSTNIEAPSSAGPTTAIYLVATPTEHRDGHVSRDGVRIGSSPRRARVLGYLQWAINRQVIERSANERLILHASAAERDGVAVAMPAAMESGKTTLVTGLLERGFGYLTDEAVAVADDLQVEGYRKPLSIDPGSFEVLARHRPQLPEALTGYFDDQWQVAAHGIGPVVARSRLGLLVFPTYVRGAGTSFEPVRPASVIALAGPCTFGPAGAPLGTRRLRRLVRMAEQVPAFRLISGDLDEACAAIIHALTSQPIAHGT
jgi:hypothetical protein